MKANLTKMAEMAKISKNFPALKNSILSGKSRKVDGKEIEWYKAVLTGDISDRQGRLSVKCRVGRGFCWINLLTLTGKIQTVSGDYEFEAVQPKFEAVQLGLPF